jgi:Fe-S-cluster-containing hydrogenase component 2
MAKQLMLKPEKCTGCRTCEVICSFNRAKNFNPRNAAVSVMIYDEAAISVPVMCLQCEEACCVSVCPVGACAIAPAMVVDGEYFPKVKPDDVAGILETCRGKSHG